jgi:hypothetical protein
MADSGRVPVVSQLNEQSWDDFFTLALRESRRRGAALLGLHSDDPIQQEAAVWDAFAIGRFDARAFIMLRRSLHYLEISNLPAAIFALAHCVPFHPDIYWTKNNTIDRSVKAAVCQNFKWSVDDVVVVLQVVDDENMFTRGSIGEDVYLLLSEGWGPDVLDLFVRTLGRSVELRDEDIAYKVAALLQYEAGEDALSALEWAMERYPELRGMPKVNDLLSAVRANGWLDIA